MKVMPADKRGIALAVEFLKVGKSLAYPTDTSYGLAVNALNPAAIKKLYRIKERGFNKPVHIIVPSFAYANRIAVISPQTRLLFKKFLPGPLTIVLKLKPAGNLPLARGRNRGGRGRFSSWELLSANTHAIGIRIPDQPVALALVRKFGGPITATSANLSGGSDSYSARDVAKQFKNKKYHPDLILDGGRLRRRKPSTVVALTNGRVTILRQGPISKKAILKALDV